MRIGELVQRCGLSAHTLRYYERIGLLPRAHRNTSRQRDYDPAILTWIEFLNRLKTMDMPIKDMLRYAKLREKGPSTEPDRSKLLQEHRELVRARLADLQNCLAVLDGKIAGYAPSTKQMKEKNDKSTLRRK